MTLKQIKILNIFIIFLLCFPAHFIYTWFPSTITSIFFPVNESIWEHMKMLFSAIIIAGILEYIVRKKTKNHFTNLLLTAIISIPIFLILYLPLYNIFGENLIINFGILFITIVITQIINYKLSKNETNNYLESISIIGIILVYIIFAILTYYPPKNNLFYDYNSNKYGINTYKFQNTIPEKK